MTHRVTCVPKPLTPDSPRDVRPKARVELEEALLLQGLQRAVPGALVRHGAVGVGGHLLHARLDKVEGQAARGGKEAGDEGARAVPAEPVDDRCAVNKYWDNCEKCAINIFWVKA